MSIHEKHGVAGEWRMAAPADVPEALREAVGGHPLLARLLAQRGVVDPAQARAYLDPAHYTPSAPTDLPGVADAAELIGQAAASGLRARVWGDTDADGETATAVLAEVLAALGLSVDYRLPTGGEGHGLSMRAVDEAVSDGVSILVTCDTGIEAAQPAYRAREAHLALVITDHHDLPDEMPRADAVVNPKLLPAGHPARGLSGVGVAYMLAQALLEGKPSGDDLLGDLLDLAAIGTVADMAEQVGDVRYLTQLGVAALHKTERPGIRALAATAGVHLSATERNVIPHLSRRLDSAVLQDATWAVRLLLTKDHAEATGLAQRLESISRDRQARTDALLTQVGERMRADPDLARQPVIVLDGENWEAGVLGLVASRLAHEYDRPAVLITHSAGHNSTASARSAPGIDIHAAIASQRRLLVREGGHPMAAGFAIEPANLPIFKQGLIQNVAQQVAVRPAQPPITVEAELPWSELTLDLARALERLGPFGPGNPAPLLLSRGGVVVRTEDVSRTRETAHRRLFVEGGTGTLLRVTWLNARDLPQLGEAVDLAYRVGTNRRGGEEQLDVLVEDWRPAQPDTRSDAAALVGGREVVDWRSERDWRVLLARLQSAHGEGLVLWAEGTDQTVPGGLSRCELHRATALAILTPPPEPAVLRAALAATQASRVYLLPAEAPAELSAGRFVQRVAGMVRVAVRARAGRLDVTRMAARLAARESAVLAALRGLEAAGKLSLAVSPDGIVASLPESTENQDASGHKVTENSTQVQERIAISYHLAETAAYRDFYATAPLDVVLSWDA